AFAAPALSPLVLPAPLLSPPEPALAPAPAPPASPPASASAFFLPVLKSVSYQPEPFRRKLAAETRLASAALPQAGQSFSGGSLIFWSFSTSAPQDSQRYS